MSTQATTQKPTAPILFKPVYKVLVWGGRRMAEVRDDLPEGPVGESWEIADLDEGGSVAVADGPGVKAGDTLKSLTERHGTDLVGDGFPGGDFPLLIKLIDARDKLSVQVHPDDAGAQAMGLGPNGKTECWYMVGDGGTLFQGTKKGVTKEVFEKALADGQVADTLNEFQVSKGDFFFLPAKTVHALAAGCLLFEVQQTSNITFRVDDWGRVGLDGKPRPLHVKESLDTIDFSEDSSRPQFGPVEGLKDASSPGVRVLASCSYFKVEELTLAPGMPLTRDLGGTCAIVMNVDGDIRLAGGQGLGTQAHDSSLSGTVSLKPFQSALVPASARGYTIQGNAVEPQRVLVAQPVFAG